MVRYKCGCIAGERLCPKAERLWRHTGSAYESAKQDQNWAEYELMRAAYRTHMEMREVADAEES